MKLGYSYFGQPRGNSTLTTCKNTLACCTDNFVPLVAVTQQKADNSNAFIKACQDLQWTHDTHTPHRSATNGRVERAVAMECYCYSRNVHDEMADGKTAYEKKLWRHIRWIFDPVRSQSQLQAHLFEKRGKSCINWSKNEASWNLHEIRTTCGGRWSGDLFTADCEDLENLSASDLHVKRFEHHEVAQEGKLLFPSANGSCKIFDLDQHPPGAMPVKENPEQDEHEEEDTIFRRTKPQTLWEYEW